MIICADGEREGEREREREREKRKKGGKKERTPGETETEGERAGGKERERESETQKEGNRKKSQSRQRLRASAKIRSISGFSSDPRVTESQTSLTLKVNVLIDNFFIRPLETSP